MSPVLRLDIAYDGSGFRGYAKQSGQRTVQGELETALETLLGEPVDTSVAGRTDAGVHARQQVVSFQIDDEVDLERLRRSLTGMLGPEVSVVDADVESADFDARFSARWRRYRYLINPRPAPDPLMRHVTWHVGRDLDVAAMEDVAQGLIGEHDFTSFCRSVEGRSNVRRVDEAHWVEREGLLQFWIRANAFCHQMVRSVVGYCYDVGRGFSAPGSIAEVIAARDRSRVATVAPAHGLTLWEVSY